MTTKIIRSFTASPRELAMLDAVAAYHGLNKSGTLTSLVKREFWRIFPAGTGDIFPDEGARVDLPAAVAQARVSRHEPKRSKKR